jgi:hypothetical protein
MKCLRAATVAFATEQNKETEGSDDLKSPRIRLLKGSVQIRLQAIENEHKGNSNALAQLDAQMPADSPAFVMT